MTNLINKLSKHTRNIILIIGRLIGVEQTKKGLDAKKLVIAAYIFILGIPLGIIIAGQNMPIAVWAFLVATIFIITNLDAAIVLASELNKEGPVGKTMKGNVKDARSET